jgi:hypothetical protein
MGGVRRYRLTAPIIAEHPLQAQIARVLGLEIGPPGKLSPGGVVWYCIDHANYAGEVPGVRLGRGVISGILDLYLLYRGRAYHVEIKTVSGVLSDAQKSVATALLGAGGQVAVVSSVEMLLGCLDEWGIPRARRVRVAA